MAPNSITHQRCKVFNLKNRTVFITGASAGIGAACADVFAAAGARLILAARRTDKLADLGSRLTDEFGAEILTIELDVRSNDNVRRAVETLGAGWADIDILINNAGLSRGLDPIQRGDLNDWEEMIDTNVKGLLYVSRAVLPGMVERKKGHVINIGSIAGREVYPSGNVYCASKHAVRALTRGMQIDLNGTGVRVTEIDPGMVETEFSIVRFHGDADKAKGVYRGMTPLTSRDVAETVLFCATRPPHVNVHELLLMPTDQASASIVDRRL